MENNNRNRGQQKSRGLNQEERTSSVGNRQSTTQIGGQNNGGRNRDQNDDLNIRSGRNSQNAGNRGSNR